VSTFKISVSHQQAVEPIFKSLWNTHQQVMNQALHIRFTYF